MSEVICFLSGETKEGRGLPKKARGACGGSRRAPVGVARTAAVLVAVAFALVVQFAEGFEISDYFRINRVVELAMSYDGRFVAYAVESASLEKDATDRRLYIQAVDGDTPPIHREELDGARRLAWRPGTHELAFLDNREGNLEVVGFDVDKKQLHQYTQGVGPVAAFRFSSTGLSIAFLVRETNLASLSLFDRIKEGKSGVLVDTTTEGELDFLAPRVPPAPSRLCVASLAGGAVVQVPAPGEVEEFYWSTSAPVLSVTYVGNDVPPSLERRMHTSVGIYDVVGGQFTVVAKGHVGAAERNSTNYAGGEWALGESKILLRRTTSLNPWVSGAFPQWTFLDVRHPAPLERASWNSPVETYRGIDGNLQFIPNADGSFLLEDTLAARSSLFMVSGAGLRAARAAGGVEGGSSFFRFSADRHRVAFVTQSVTSPPEIYVRADGHPPRRLTKLNAELAGARIPQVREITWTSSDGATVHGWLFEPADSVDRPSKKPVPLLTYVHGGPTNVFGDDFATNFKWWPYPFEVYATHGIAVFVPNYRGTSTFGEHFKSPSALDKEPVDDVLTGVRSLVERGIADPERLGLSGHSHGAWLGPLVMTKSRIFRAVSFAEGTPNLLSLYTLMPGRLNHEIHDVEFGADAYDSPQRYLDLSPEMHFSGLRTAALFEAGTEASAIDMIGFPKAAQHFDIPTEYYVYPHTGHNITSPRFQKESAERNLDWFMFWLQGEEDTSPAKSQQNRRWELLCDMQRAENPNLQTICIGAKRH